MRSWPSAARSVVPGKCAHIRRGKIAGAGDPGEGLSGCESIGGRFGVGEDADAPGFRDCSGCGQALEGAQADDAGEIIAGEAGQAVIGAGGDDELVEGEGDRAIGADEKRLARLLVEADAGRAEQMRQRRVLACQSRQLGGIGPLEAGAAAEGCFRFHQKHITAGRVMRERRGHAGDAAAHDQHLTAAIAPLAGDGRQASRQGGRGGEAAQPLEVELAERAGREEMLLVEPGRQAFGDAAHQAAPAAARRGGCLGGLAGQRDTAVGQSDAALLAPAGMAEGAARAVQAEAVGENEPPGAERCGGGVGSWKGGIGHRLRSYI